MASYTTNVRGDVSSTADTGNCADTAPHPEQWAHRSVRLQKWRASSRILTQHTDDAERAGGPSAGTMLLEERDRGGLSVQDVHDITLHCF